MFPILAYVDYFGEIQWLMYSAQVVTIHMIFDHVNPTR